MTNYEEIINTLNSDTYYNLRNDILKLVNDSTFIKKIIRIHNPILFDRFIKMCEFKIDTSIIYEERNKFIKKTLGNLNKNNIYEFFELDNLEEERKEIIASRYLSEYIINYYFLDNFYNFMANFYQMTGYLIGDRKSLININHIELYRQFINLTKMSFEDKIKLFNNNLNNDLKEMFYDDIDIVRVNSHRKLVEYTLKLNKDNGLYQKELSNKNNVDIYYLNGEKFYGFVRRITLREGNINGEKTHVFSQKRRLGYSFSYISSYDIGTIDFTNNSLLLYYDNIDYRNIMYVHHTDMHTGIIKRLTTYITDKENEIKSPEGLINMTVNYNEIYIKPGKEGIKPTAIVCFDAINDNVINFAKEYNLSILIINKEKYMHEVKYDDDYRDYTYIL